MKLDETEVIPTVTGYTTEETRVHKRAYAPKGHIFIVVKCRNKTHKYSNYHIIPIGLSAEVKGKVAVFLYEQLVKKYKI